MMQSEQSLSHSRRNVLLIAGLLLLAGGGCSNEPEVFRSTDRVKAVAAIKNKTQDHSRPPGLPKGKSRSPR
jgi:hypothetical protein